MSFPNHVTGNARVALGREWGKRSAAKWQPREPDPETLAYRGVIFILLCLVFVAQMKRKKG